MTALRISGERTTLPIHVRQNLHCVVVNAHPASMEQGRLNFVPLRA